MSGTWSLSALCAALLAGLVMGAAGGWRVQEWRWQANTAAAAQAASEALQSDQRQQRRLADAAAGQHAAALVSINRQLGVAREKIASLSGRQCLDAGTVGVLNAIGGDVDLRAAAGDTQGAAGAAASDRDVAAALAACRSAYATVRNQVIQILDIEDKRHPVQTSGHE
jgi:hypothetical protein